MAAFNLSPQGSGQYFFTAAGVLANLGTVTTYQAGTTTPQATYTGPTGAVLNPNPIVMSNGFCPQIFIPAGVSLKLLVQDALGNTITTLDNITGVGDTTSFASTFSEWLAQPSITPVFSSTTQFSTSGNTTPTFQVGRRCKLQVSAGTVYGTVTSATFGANTVVNLDMDTGQVLDSGLTTVAVGLLGTTGLGVSVPMAWQNDLSLRNLLAAGTLGVTGTSTLGVANMASGAISGIMTAPTATNGTNTTQLATTQFVQSAVPLLVPTSLCYWGAGNAAAQSTTGLVNYQTVATQLGLTSFTSGVATVTTGGTYLITATISMSIPGGIAGSSNLQIYIGGSPASAGNTSYLFSNSGVNTGGNLVLTITGIYPVTNGQAVAIQYTAGGGQAVIASYGSFTGVRIA